MSEFTAIRAVSRTLRTLLEEHITNNPDPQLEGTQIYLLSPKEMRNGNGNGERNGISLWLYRVARDGYTLNVQQRGRRIIVKTAAQQLPSVSGGAIIRASSLDKN